jgi:hypothetical protein
MRQSLNAPTFAQTLDGVTHIDLAQVEAIIEQIYTALNTGRS